MRRLARLALYGGVVTVVAGLSKYHAQFIGVYDFTNSFRFAWAGAYIVILALAAYGFGLPETATDLRSRITSAISASGTGAVSMSVVQLAIGDALLPRFVVFGAAAALVPWYVAVATLSALGRAAAEERDRVVVVGGEALARELIDELAAAPERPASIVARLSVDEARAVDERHRPVVDAVLDAKGTVLVLDGEAQFNDAIVDQAAVLHEAGVRVRTHSLFFEEWLGKLPVKELGRVALFFDIGEVHRDRFGRVKRIIDVAAGAVGIVVLVVIVPLVAIFNRVGNRGPTFYRQERTGWRGQTFTILKFRSMLDDPDAGTDWTSESDARITAFGSVLRRSHLDELPQMWNILRGDLSLVGPRPEQPQYVAELASKLPYYHLRHSVRPGLTGWAQVKYGYAGDERDALEKLQYDFHYLRHQSILFDLRIIGRTVRSVVGGAGR